MGHNSARAIRSRGRRRRDLRVIRTRMVESLGHECEIFVTEHAMRRFAGRVAGISLSAFGIQQTRRAIREIVARSRFPGVSIMRKINHQSRKSGHGGHLKPRMPEISRLTLFDDETRTVLIVEHSMSYMFLDVITVWNLK